MTLSEVAAICSKNDLHLSAQDCVALEHFSVLLANWNSRINLISRKDEEHILDRHILHSLSLRMPAICDYAFAGKRALDLGTGGGLPGIPLKIVTPSMDMTLVDSIQKKIIACQSMIAELKLPGIRAVCARAEELAKQAEHAHQYDVVVSRAVAPLDDLVKWSKGLLKPAGVLFSLKGGELMDEIRHAERIKAVDSIEVRPLDVKEYDGFLREEKKLVRVNFV